MISLSVRQDSCTQLPIHALVVGEDERRLLDVVNVIYAPAAGVIAQLQRTPVRGGGTLVAATGLEHADDEAAAVSALVDQPIVLTGDATPEAVVTQLAAASRLHICSHGLYVPEDYLASRIELVAHAQRDGYLTVARLLAVADLSGIDLAVVGSCFSGAGQTVAGALDVPGGIDSALLAAGVHNVISALWEIDDFAALLYHAEFYLHLASGCGLLSAYRAAVDLLRSGRWRSARTENVGRLLQSLGVDLDAAFDAISDDSGADDIDFARIEYWSPFRICGVGRLASES